MASIQLQIVGGGNMGAALLSGVLRSEVFAPQEVLVVERDAARRSELSAAHPGLETAPESTSNADAILAVKPQHVLDVAAGLAEVGVQRMLSVAAGITTAAIEASAPGAAVVRCMPNTPALVGQGVSAIAPGSGAGDSDLDWAEQILAEVGLVVRVDESEMDAVTAISGSGPAYVFHLGEAMTSAGIAHGLTPDVADALVRQTLLGAATLLSASSEGPDQLRRNVTSPGGTTEAGLREFESANFVDVVHRVVTAAVTRSKELGQR